MLLCRRFSGYNFKSGQFNSVQAIVQLTMSLIGNIKKFNPAGERLQSYLDRLGSYFRTNKIGILPQDVTAAQLQKADQENVDALISMIGIQGYGVMANACNLDSPAGKLYKELVTVLKSHYVQIKVEIAETFKFHQVMLQKDENFVSFVGRLCSTASTCNYGNYLSRALRDQFVVSKTRTLEECIKLPTAGKAALLNIAQLHGAKVTQPELHAVSVQKKPNRSFRSPGSRNSA